MAMKVNLRFSVEREMEELLPLSGMRSKTAYINEAVRELNERLRREREITTLREYFSRRRGELRSLNRELRSVAFAVDED